MTTRPMSERIFDMHESGKPTAEIAALFDLTIYEVNSILSRVRKRRKRKKMAEVAG